ncbi:MAG: hypothetical protein OEX83_05370 [Gammaproteobacteria bacterium]|nr:hypothetical protein [Gammaproteobacteria bacterium]
MPLDLWYGEPLTKYQAEQLLQFSLEKRKQALFKGLDCFHYQVKEIIAHFFLNQNINIEYKTLVHSTQNEQQIALIELVFGQLLMCRKLNPALDHLKKGFSIAQKHISSADYFGIAKRHELLERLKLGKEPSEPKTLASLLVEGSVIKQLETSSGLKNRYSKNPHDTLG